MNLPIKPIIAEQIIIRHDGALKGDIEPGEVFAWNPDSKYGRELCIVREIKDGWVGTWDMKYKKLCYSPENNFRECCFRTMFNRFPDEPPKYPFLVKFEFETK